jgi:hypothetical protein
MKTGGAAILCGLALCATAAAAPGATARPVAAARPARSAPFRIPSWIKNLAHDLGDFRESLGDVPKEVVKHGLEDWLRSGGTYCPFFLPSRYFCPRQHSVWSYWGVGYALSFGGKVPGAWSTPYKNRTFAYPLEPGKPFWLTCWTYGQRSSDGDHVTGLWYQLTDGFWVNDAWLDTGTNFRIPGVSHC